MEEREGILREEEKEDTAAIEDDFKRKAVALAATFGDSSVYRYDCYSQITKAWSISVIITSVKPIY